MNVPPHHSGENLELPNVLCFQSEVGQNTTCLSPAATNLFRIPFWLFAFSVHSLSFCLFVFCFSFFMVAFEHEVVCV